MVPALGDSHWAASHSARIASFRSGCHSVTTGPGALSDPPQCLMPFDMISCLANIYQLKAAACLIPNGAPVYISGLLFHMSVWRPAGVRCTEAVSV